MGVNVCSGSQAVIRRHHQTRSAPGGEADEIGVIEDIGLDCRTSALEHCTRKWLARFWRATPLFEAINCCLKLSYATSDLSKISYLALTPPLGKGGVGGSIPPRGTRISRHAETLTQPVPAESFFNFRPGTLGTGYRRSLRGSPRRAGDDEGFVEEPEAAMFVEHRLGRP